MNLINTTIKTKKVFKHNTPLIKQDVKALGKKELDKSAEMGPVPVEGDIIKLEKRKQISSVKEKNYLLNQRSYFYTFVENLINVLITVLEIYNF